MLRFQLLGLNVCLDSRLRGSTCDPSSWELSLCGNVFPCSPKWGEIGIPSGKGIEKHPEAFNDNFNLHLFLERYASNDATDGNPFLHSRTFEAGNHEWQCWLEVPTQRQPLRLICCPEDVLPGPRCRHERHILCGDCQIPLCNSCVLKARSSHTNHRIPMALANDNFAGYTTDLLARYKVRWLEAAIVSPC